MEQIDPLLPIALFRRRLRAEKTMNNRHFSEGVYIPNTHD